VHPDGERMAIGALAAPTSRSICGKTGGSAGGLQE
jgi:hypothetical protein